jgi:hypothetical protein
MSGRLEEQASLDRAIRRIRDKPALRAFYDELYAKFADCLSRCPSDGAVLELGSGGGYLRDVIPDEMTSDVLPYPTIENIDERSQGRYGCHSE